MLCDRMYRVCQKQVKDLVINNYVFKKGMYQHGIYTNILHIWQI
jgi:hypothetical protein